MPEIARQARGATEIFHKPEEGRGRAIGQGNSMHG